MLPQFMITYLILVNAAAFLFMLIDKSKAKRGAWRIPERTLLGSAILGGSLGAITAMYLFHHKTKHSKFAIGIPVILIIQIIVIAKLV